MLRPTWCIVEQLKAVVQRTLEELRFGVCQQTTSPSIRREEPGVHFSMRMESSLVRRRVRIDSMDSNPYKSPPETPHEKRTINLAWLILVASLTAAMVLAFFDAPRWLIIVAGAASALAAEELIRKSWV